MQCQVYRAFLFALSHASKRNQYTILSTDIDTQEQINVARAIGQLWCTKLQSDRKRLKHPSLGVLNPETVVYAEEITFLSLSHSSANNLLYPLGNNSLLPAKHTRWLRGAILTRK